jgi:hypothetical protein
MRYVSQGKCKVPMLAVYYIDMWNMGTGILDFILKIIYQFG